VGKRYLNDKLTNFYVLLLLISFLVCNRNTRLFSFINSAFEFREIFIFDSYFRHFVASAHALNKIFILHFQK